MYVLQLLLIPLPYHCFSSKCSSQEDFVRHGEEARRLEQEKQRQEHERQKKLEEEQRRKEEEAQRR